jgi:two-component system KDP operon response regulator KdpE
VETIDQLREASDVPIVILTMTKEPIAAACLRAGADAVLIKPFSAELLIAQLDLLATRLRPFPSEQDIYTLAQLTVDFTARAVFVDSERIHLSAREFRLLQVLISNAGRVITHTQLLQLTWGPGYEDSGDLLRGYIRNLRRKFRDDARRPHLIFTESQVGYWMPHADRGA